VWRRLEPPTHLIGLSIIRLAGLPSAILSSRTGLVLIYSLTISNRNDLGASVLTDPEVAWDRETLYPAFRSADLCHHISVGLALRGRGTVSLTRRGKSVRRKYA
jgi:hypothetical protein